MPVRLIRVTHPAAAIALFLFCACGGSDPSSPPPPPPPPVSVTLTPANAAVPAGGTQAFSATVANAMNAAVTWTASGGDLTPNGTNATWQAPVSGGTYTITATSAADVTKSAAATISVSPVTVTVAPTSIALYRGEPAQFSAAVSGAVAGSAGVRWSASCGNVTATGDTLAYVAPATPGACTITATSTLDSTRTASAAVTVRTTLLVDRTADGVDTTCTWSNCTLRAALAIAQATAAVDTIRLGLPPAASAEPVTAVAALTGTISLGAALPVITTPVAIIGPGADVLTLDANGSPASPRRALQFEGDVVASVRGLTIRGGHTPGAGGVAVGGGADVSFTDVVLRDNVSTQGAGGGLGVFGASTARLANTHVFENRAEGASGAGAGIDLVQGSTLQMTGGSIRGNVVPDGFGAGLRQLDAFATLTNVDVTENEALLLAGGGGIMADGAGTLSMQGGRVADNITAGSGGGLWVRGATTVSLDSVTVQRNRADGGSGGGLLLQNDASVTLSDGVIAENRSATNGGGLAVSDNTTLALVRMQVQANVATNAGGGLSLSEQGAAVLSGTSIVDNESRGTGFFGGGGGVLARNASTVSMSGGVIRANQVLAVSGGGVFLNDSAAITLDSVAVQNNRSVADGAGMVLFGGSRATLRDATVSGNAHTGTGSGGGIASYGTSQLSLVRTAVTGNATTGVGGGVIVAASAQATVEGGVIAANQAAQGGGGVFKGGFGTLAMAGTEVRGNTSGGQGGGVLLAAPASGTGGAATLDRLTIHQNSATASGGGLVIGVPTTLENSTINANTSANGIGGGIFSGLAGTPVITNVTISGNSALVGGGVGATGTGTFRQVTIVGNTSSQPGAGVYSNNAGAVSLAGVLLARNRVDGTVLNCATGATARITSVGYNLSDDISCATLVLPTDLPNTAAGVSDSLADNGGPTRTHALQPGSAAIDAGSAPTCPATDQRGRARVGPCDIGAYEFGAPAARASVGKR